MSVSKWKYTPACDGDYCVGDCELCDKEPEAEEEIPTKTKYVRVREILYLMKFNTEQISQTVSTELMEKVLNRMDGVDIIRCKDCKHARKYEGQTHSWLYCENWRAIDDGNNEGYYHIEDDFFCADGERRESE